MRPLPAEQVGLAGSSAPKETAELASCWLGAQHLSPGADAPQLEAGTPEVERSPPPPLLGRVKDKQAAELQQAWAGHGVLSQGASPGPGYLQALPLQAWQGEGELPHPNAGFQPLQTGK